MDDREKISVNASGCGSDCDTGKLLTTIGLCRKAGKLICGTPMICDAMKRGNPPEIVLEACDMSDNTHKKLTDKCTFYKVEMIRLAVNGEALAKAVGKQSYLAAVAVTDKNLRHALKL